MWASRLLRKTNSHSRKFNRFTSRLNSNYKYYGYGDRLKISFEEGPLSIPQIKDNINKDRTFCGDETSITRRDLSGYINNNTVIYSYKNGLAGVMVLGKNSKGLYIYGICVPPKYKGIGTKLMNIAKDIARDNNIPKIVLECYGDVHLFYEKKGYTIVKTKEIVNSNNDEIIKYVMEYTIGPSPKVSSSSPRTPRVSSPKTRKSKSKSKSKNKNKNYFVENINK